MGYMNRGLGDQRRDIRFPTSFRAAIQWNDRLFPVEVVDIANHGVRLSGTDLPGVASMIRIGARGLDERGYVVWRANGHCGVHLVRRISALGVVRSNCFPVRHGHPERYAPEQLPVWLDEDLLSDSASDVGNTGHISAAHLPGSSSRMTRGSH